LYVVAGKSTSFLGGLGIHAGVNRSLEIEDGDRDPNLFCGVHKWINAGLVLLGEYDTALNDNSNNAIGSGKGYLNAAARLSLVEGLWFEAVWKNIRSCNRITGQGVRHGKEKPPFSYSENHRDGEHWIAGPASGGT
jgi:hypothetical protein